MENERNYLQDIAEIRSMMERSSKFLSLSGWAGVMAGIYALSGAWIAYTVFDFYPDEIFYNPAGLPQVILLALAILTLSLSTAVYLSWKKGNKKGEKVWNSTSKLLIANMAVPLSAGGILILILLSKGYSGLMIPLTLLFYGLALYNSAKFTYDDVKYLGIIQIGLGLISTWFIEHSLLFWAAGFGIVHIIYGIYLQFKYER